MNNVSEDMTATGQGENALNVMTISKADRWVDELLPRFAAYVDANCTGVVHRHLLLIDEPGLSANRRSEMLDQLQQRWHSVVLRPPLDEQPGQRLLTFDALRAGLLTAFGLSEGLYLDPDTDVVVVGVKGNRLVVRPQAMHQDVADATAPSEPDAQEAAPDAESLDFDVPETA